MQGWPRSEPHSTQAPAGRGILGGMDRPEKRRWFQFSLRTLLVFVTLCAILCSWVGEGIRQAEREKTAERAISPLGAHVQFNLGELDFFDCAVSAEFSNPEKIGDKELEYVKEFRWLRHLDLANTKVTDKGLEFLAGLKHLEDLSLEGANVTEDGVTRLRRALPNCKIKH